MLAFLILGLILGALVIILAAQNLGVVTVTFLAWTFQGSLALILVIAAAVGILICAFLSLPDMWSKRLTIYRLRKENNELREELAHKRTEVDSEKSKLAANNAYIDGLEDKTKIAPRVAEGDF